MSRSSYARSLALVALLSTASLSALAGPAASVAGLEPDLIVTSISPSSAPVEDVATTFVAQVKNEGAAGSGAFNVRFLLDGKLLGTVRVLLLAPGETKQVEMGWTATGGSHGIQAIADANGEVAESNEANNARASTFDAAWTSRPDLAVALAIEPSSPYPGGEVAIVATVRNDGRAPANASIEVRVDGTLLTATMEYSLAPGATTVATATWAAHEGSHTVTATVDGEGAVAENSESNNEATATIFTRPPASVEIVTSLTLSDVDLLEGEVTSLVATIANVGDLGAERVLVELELDGVLVRQHFIDAIAPSGSAVVRSDPWTATKGPHTVTARANATQATERSGASDVASFGFVVVAPPAPTPPDLLVDLLQLTPTSPVESQVAEVVARVRNAGETETDDSHVRFTVDGAEIAVTSIPGLSPGASTTARVGWRPTLGTHVLAASADPNGIVAEGDESNNARELSVPVAEDTTPAIADLVITAIGVLPSHPAPGEATKFVATVVNQGDAAAQAFQVQFLLDGTTLGATSPVILLGAGEQTLVQSAEWIATDGRHSVTAIADSSGAVSESNEANNEVTELLPVQPQPTPLSPDIVLVNVDTSILSPADGDATTLFATIRNDGAGPAGGFEVQFLVDDVLFATVPVVLLQSGETMQVTSPAWMAVGAMHELEAIGDASGTNIELSETNNAFARMKWIRAPNLFVSTLEPTSLPRDGYETSLEATVENPAYEVIVGDLFQDDLESLGLWTVTESGGTHFRNAASGGYSTAQSLSPSTSMTLGFSGAACCQDNGEIKASRTFDVTSVGHVRFAFKTTSYAHAGESSDSLEAGIRLTRLAANGATIGSSYEWWVSSWAGTSSNNKTGSSISKSIFGQPPLNTWITVDRDVSDDFTIGWGTTARVRVDVFVESTWATRDAYRFYVDDLRLVAGEVIVAGQSDARPSTTSLSLTSGEAWSIATPAIPVGASATVASPAWLASRGDATATAIADAPGQLAEVDEGDNALALGLHVLAADLTVPLVGVTPATIRPGDAVSLTATVANAGGRSAQTILRLLVDDVVVGEFDVAALEDGAVAALSTPWTATGGDHVLRAVADAAGTEVEESEANNQATLAFHVELPDLELLDVSTSPAAPQVGAPTELVALVANSGLSDAGAFVVRFLVDGTTVADAPVGPLAAGSSELLRAPWAAAPGSHQVSAIADPEDLVPEEPGSNNAVEDTIWVKAPDLRLTELALQSAVHGSDATFRATIENHDFPEGGSTVIKEPFNAPLGWTVSKTGFLGSAQAGITSTRSASPPTAAILSFNGGGSGSDFGVLSLSRTFPVDALREIKVKMFMSTYFHDRGTFDDMTSAMRIVGLDANGAVVVSQRDYILSGWFRSTDNRTPVAGQKLVWGMPPAFQWVEFVGHPAQDFGVSYAAVKQLKVELYVSASGTVGDAFTVTYDDLEIAETSTGTGGGLASPPSLVRLTLDGAPFADIDVPALAPGQTATVESITWRAIGGDHSVGALVDPDGSIAELVETNNALQANVHVAQPDLRASAVSLSPASPQQGDLVAIQATLVNDGDATAAASMVRFLVDGAPLGLVAVPAVAPGATVQVAWADWPAAGGDHDFRAEADAQGIIEEIDESDNARVARLHVRQPDLEVLSIVTGSALEDAAPAVFQVSLLDRGDAPAGPFVVGLTIDGVSIGTVSVSGLAAGATTTVSSPMWPAVGGDHVVRATADAANEIIESSEANNVRETAFFVRRADLTVASITPSIASPVHGQSVSFNALVSNVEHQVVSEITLLDDFETPALWTAVEGGGSSFRSAASEGYVTDRWTSPTTAVDLRFSGGGSSTDFGGAILRRVFDVTRIDELRIRYNVDSYSHDRNFWDGLESGVSVVLLDANGATIATKQYWLAAWSQSTNNARMPLPAGVKLIGSQPTLDTWHELVADPTADFGISWSGVDAVAIELFVSAGGTVGDTFRIVFDDLSIQTTGETPGTSTARDFEVRFLVDGAPIGGPTVTSLAPGASVGVTSPAWAALGGDHVVTVVADARDRLAEADEANNTRAIPLHVRRADLQVIDLAPSPANPHTGDRITISATVRNVGDAPAGRFDVRLLLDGGLLLDASVESLGAGASTTITSGEWKAQKGAHTVLAIADVADAIDESTETDNERVLDFAVDPIADLVIDDLMPSTPAPRSGEPVTFRATVRNAGDTGARPFSVAFYVDDVLASIVQVEAARPGESVLVESPPWTGTLGIHRLRAVADSTGVVAEGVESNNERTWDFAVL